MTKRANAEGTVRQRPDGRWEARVSYVDPITGRRRRVSLYGGTAEEVRAKLDKARDRVKTEAPVQDSNIKLSQWIDHWTETTLEASPRKGTTKQLYKSLAHKHLSPAPLGTIPLDKLRKSHVDGLLVKLRKQKLSDSTVRQIYTILRQSSPTRNWTAWSLTTPSLGCHAHGSRAPKQSISTPPR